MSKPHRGARASDLGIWVDAQVGKLGFWEMGKFKRAARAVIDESNPVTFVRRLREMPFLRRIFAIIDRLL